MATTSSPTPWFDRLVGAAIILVAVMVGLEFFERMAGGFRSAPAALALSVPDQPVRLDGAELKGNPAAAIVIIEHADLHCPACRAFATTSLPDLLERYVATGRVQLAFRHFPLEKLHPLAMRASVAATCAGHQGRFWALHDLLFAEPGAIADLRGSGLSSSMQLDHDAFGACLDQGIAIEQEIRADASRSRALGVRATPTFFVGRRLADGSVRVLRAMAGAVPFEQLAEVIEPLLSED